MRRLMLVGIALALASCGAKDDRDEAEAAVEAFHEAYDQGEYGPVWDRSAQAMKDITGKQQFLDLMTAIHARLGEVKSTKQTGWNVNYATEGSQVTMTYETTFANGEGTETFIYDTAKPPQLMGWHVVSPALLEPAPMPSPAPGAPAAVDAIEKKPG